MSSQFSRTTRPCFCESCTKAWSAGTLPPVPPEQASLKLLASLTSRAEGAVLRSTEGRSSQRGLLSSCPPAPVATREGLYAVGS